MAERPLFGVGPDHWVLVVKSFDWDSRQEAHTLWLQTGAELGVPGLAALLLYYGLCAARLWPIARGVQPVPDPWLARRPRWSSPGWPGSSSRRSSSAWRTWSSPITSPCWGPGC